MTKSKLLIVAAVAVTFSASVPAVSQVVSPGYATLDQCDAARAEARRTLSVGLKGRILGRFNQAFNKSTKCVQIAGAGTPDDPADDLYNFTVKI